MAVLAGFAGAGGLAWLVLLAVIVASAALLLEAVGRVVDGTEDRGAVVTSGAALVLFVAATALRSPRLAICPLVLLAIGEVASASARRELPEPYARRDLPEAPASTVSRAA